MRLLILDGDSNVGLAVLQSLGRRGYRCCVASNHAKYPAQWSRYASETAVCPHPLRERQAFEAWILDFQRARRFDLILPVMETTLIPLHGLRETPELRGVVALPPADAVEVAFDKEKLRRLAVSLGVPTPGTLFLERPDPAALDAWLKELPVVVKAVRSKVWGAGGGHMVASVARSADVARAAVERLLRVSPVQVQRWVPGRGMGVEVLVSHGRIVMAFAHRRLHESLKTVPPATYREAVEPPPPLLAAASRILERLAWHGVAMVEFRVDEAGGRSWLLEINGRFWGSLPLAIHAGADFPVALVEMWLTGREPAPYRQNGRFYARNVVQDLLWTKENLKTIRLLPTLLEWARVLSGREAWDGASWRDPLPFVRELLVALGRRFGRLSSNP